MDRAIDERSEGGPARSGAWIAKVAALALLAGLVVAPHGAGAGGLQSSLTGDETPLIDPVLPEPGDALLIDPPNHDFGEVPVGEESEPQTFTVTNSTEDDGVDIFKVEVDGSGAAEFTMVEDKCSEQFIRIDGSCTVTVRFAPNSEGEKEAEILIPYTPSLHYVSDITGTGVPKAPPSRPDPPLVPPETESDPLRYDLFLKRQPIAEDLTSPDGVTWFPLVRRITDDGWHVAVGKIPDSRDPRADWSTGGATAIFVVNSRTSQRESLPTTISFATGAPMEIRPPLTRPDSCEAIPGTGAVGAIRGIRCSVSPLPRAGVDVFSLSWAWQQQLITNASHGRKFRNEWDLVCRFPTETDCTNNDLKGVFGLSFPPRSKPTGVTQWARQFDGVAQGPATPAGRRSRANRSEAIAGSRQRPRRTVKRADRLARVEIALVRLAKGQRGFQGGAVSGGGEPGAAATLSGRPCLWLANRRGQFKRVAAAARNLCADPLWLEAGLGRPRTAAAVQRWRLRLQRRLPAGRYVLYTRATTHRGMPEVVFSNRSGNRVPFRVDRRGQVRPGRG